MHKIWLSSLKFLVSMDPSFPVFYTDSSVAPGNLSLVQWLLPPFYSALVCPIFLAISKLTLQTQVMHWRRPFRIATTVLLFK